ncbi:MAG: hypothetical protein AB7S50_15700 [Bacteroidales bacterium]
MDKKIIAWLEDRQDTVSDQISFCKKNDLDVNIFSTDYDFYEFIKNNYFNICLIIIDIMLYSIHDLENINIQNSDTQCGFNAGWIIAERILRPEKEKSLFSQIPILFLSSRPFDDKTDKKRLSDLNSRDKSENYPDVLYLEKNGMSKDYKRTWDREFCRIIHSILNE